MKGSYDIHIDLFPGVIGDGANKENIRRIWQRRIDETPSMYDRYHDGYKA